MDATASAAIVASVINSSNLNCNNNSSSSSSGYASSHSATSTPVTPNNSSYDVPGVHSSLTPMSVPEQGTSTAVATVAPFYSETALSQQQREQCYQSYSYTGAAGQYSQVYDAYTGNSYHNLTTPNIERSLGISSSTTHNNSSSSHQQRLEKSHKSIATHNGAVTSVGVVSQHYGNTASIVTTPSTSATTKPQATATPFFAKPTTSANTGAGSAYGDTYGKYKLPSVSKLPNPSMSDYTNYTNHLQQAAAAAATYSYQQQHYYAAAKSQLQDANYAAAAAAVVKPHRQHTVNNSASYYNNNSSYYDKYEKYMYSPTASTAVLYGSGSAAAHTVPHAPTQPHPYSTHDSGSGDPYRKASSGAAVTNWHWNMEYASPAACRSLPPTGVTGNTYIPAANAVNSMDKYGKYDKYSAYFTGPPHHPQQYIAPSQAGGSSPPATTRNIWPNTPHHSPHLPTPVQPVINERLTHSLPASATQHQYPYSHSHATHHPFAVAPSVASQRQSCCTQPYQLQQNCFYPRPTQQHTHSSAPSAYGPTQQAHYGIGSSSCNSNQKYSSYGNNLKSNSSTDLYLTSPFETPPSAYNYVSSPSSAIPQRYVGATGATFYNDLNVQSAFESYAANTFSQQAMLQQHVATTTQHNVPTHPSAHLGYASHGSNQSNATTAALIDYRKTSSTAAAEGDCYMNPSRISLNSLDQHQISDTQGYFTYDLHSNPAGQGHPVIISPTTYSDGGSSSDKSTPTTKNLSLRDFLATWNEEEEEELGNATEQINFVENNEPSVKETNFSSEVKINAEATTQQSHHRSEQTVDEQDFSEYTSSYQVRPKVQVGIAVDAALEVEAGQFINLPDIVVDIEKSSNPASTENYITPTTTTDTMTSVKQPKTIDSQMHHHSPCGGHEMFENFDVEKELDQLRIKRARQCLEKQLNNEIQIFSPDEPPVVSESPEEESSEGNPILSAIQHSECEKSYEHADHFLKGMELNDTTSHSSNSSTFEKEYETFINRIDQSKNDVLKDEMNKSNDSNQKSQPVYNEDSASISQKSSDTQTPTNLAELNERNLEDSSQNLQDFTMFYKKKRKLVHDNQEIQSMHPAYKVTKPDEVIENLPNITDEKEENKGISPPTIREKYVLRYSRRCTNNKRKLFGFYKILRDRLKVSTSSLVQKHIALLKDRHLPLIKRKCFKNFTTCNSTIFNPHSLKRLTLSAVNTKAFKALFLKGLVEENSKEMPLNEENLENPSNSGMSLTCVVNECTFGTSELDKKLQNSLEAESISPSSKTFQTENVEEENKALFEDKIETKEAIEEVIEEQLQLQQGGKNRNENENENENEKMDKETHQGLKNLEEEIGIEKSTESFILKTKTSIEKEKFENRNDGNQKKVAINENSKLFEKKIDAINLALQETRPSVIILNTNELAKESDESKVNKAKFESDANVESGKEKNNKNPIRKNVEEHQQPLMRTKASVKMCDFPTIQFKTEDDILFAGRDIASEVKEVKSERSYSEALETVARIDKTKYVENWAATIDPNATQDIEELKVEPTTLSEPGATFESSNTDDKEQCVEKSLPTIYDENSNSSPSISSSSSSSSDTRSEYKSSSSSTSTSSTSKSSSSSSNESSSSNKSMEDEFNEMKALAKELSMQKSCEEDTLNGSKFQHNPEHVLIKAQKTESLTAASNESSNKDIADLKNILESGNDEKQNIIVNGVAECESLVENNVESSLNQKSTITNTPASLKYIIEAFITSKQTNNILLPMSAIRTMQDEEIQLQLQQQQPQQQPQQPNPVQCTVVPKLSDLCKNALNIYVTKSDLNKNPNIKIDELKHISEVNPPPPTLRKPPAVEHSSVAATEEKKTPPTSNEDPKELSVEEALAEMYRQAGVVSDPEDNADDGNVNANDNGENQAQDILLINLIEILENSDNENNVYLLQCDMNENILRVMTTNHSEGVVGNENANENAGERENVNFLLDDVTNLDIEKSSSGNANVDNVNSLQLVQLLSADDLEAIASDSRKNETSSMANDIELESCQRSVNSPIANDLSVNESLHNDNSYDASFADLPIIHHEEIVPDNYKQFEKEKFFKYLHGKYVQQRVNKFYHSNRIMKKYRRYSCKSVVHKTQQLGRRSSW